MLAFGMPAGSEWLVILVIVLIFFGAGRLPDVLSQVGKGVKAFKDASREDDPPQKQIADKSTGVKSSGSSAVDELDEVPAQDQGRAKRS